MSEINCCLCGSNILVQNTKYMCLVCLHKTTKEEIKFPLEHKLIRCRHCDRFEYTKSSWKYIRTGEDLFDIEEEDYLPSKVFNTPEILEFCLDKLNKIKSLKIIDASFLEWQDSEINNTENNENNNENKFDPFSIFKMKENIIGRDNIIKFNYKDKNQKKSEEFSKSTKNLTQNKNKNLEKAKGLSSRDIQIVARIPNQRFLSHFPNLKLDVQNLINLNSINKNLINDHPTELKIPPSFLSTPILFSFTITKSACPTCTRSFTPTSTGSVLQLRQRPKVSHKRTLLHLEQLLTNFFAKHSPSSNTEIINKKKKKFKFKNSLAIQSITPQKDGLDILFPDRNSASRVAAFVRQNVPVLKETRASKLVTSDPKSNIEMKKKSVCVDIAPINKGDLIFLDRSYFIQNSFESFSSSNSLLKEGAFFLVYKVTNNIYLFNPSFSPSLPLLKMSSQMYNQKPFLSFMEREESEIFEVIDIYKENEEKEEIIPFSFNFNNKTKNKREKIKVYNLMVLNQKGESFEVISEMGKFLKVGDKVRGYNLRGKITGNEKAEEFLEKYGGQEVFLFDKVKDKVGVRKRKEKEREEGLKEKEEGKKFGEGLKI